MTNNLITATPNTFTIFENSEFGTIRTILINGEPWFVGKDIATSLGYANPRDALIKRVDVEDKNDGVAICDSIGRQQHPILINESGLYSLILSSKLETAKQFKRWVTSEVLPSIRKTGSYGISNNAELSAEISSLTTQITTLKAQLEATQKLALFAARSVPQPPDYRIQYNSIAPIITKLQHLLGKSSHKEVLSYIYDTMEEHGGFNRKFAMNRLKSRYPTYYVDDKQPSIIDSIIEFPDYYEQFMKTLARVEKKLTTVVSEPIPTLSPEDQIQSIIAPLIAKRNDHSMNGIRTYGLVYKTMGSKASWSQLMRRCGVKTKKEVLLARPDKYDLFCRCVQQLMAD